MTATETKRSIMTAFYRSPGVVRALESANARLGGGISLTDNPIHGVQMVEDRGGDPVMVAMTPDEYAMICSELGKAFAKLVRL